MADGVPDAMLVNGAISREPWLLDRGLHFGDGLFETISCCKGRPRFLNLHLARLAQGCERLFFPAPDMVQLREQTMKLASGADACIVKLVVTRGAAQARGYAFTGSERPTQLLLRYPTPPQPPQRPFIVGVSSMRLGENPALAGLKHLNRLEQVLAQQERTRRHLDELLMFSSSEKLICGSMSNVFLVAAGRVLTPALDLCGVAGIMRRVVLREARRAGIQCEERPLEQNDLSSVSEVFLCNSRMGVIPIENLEGCSVVSGDLTRKIQALIAPMLAEPVDE